MQHMKTDYLERILKARVYDVAVETPLELAPNLSRPPGQCAAAQTRGHAAGVLLQAARRLQQDGQPPSRRLKRGVICASAGNHAQGVAYAAQQLGCEATIVMPATTPHIKVAAVAARGARVVLHGDSYDDAYAHAMTLARREKLTFVHPYDDPDVIAGQGTIGMEILREPQRARSRRSLRRWAAVD